MTIELFLWTLVAGAAFIGIVIGGDKLLRLLAADPKKPN